MGVDPGRAISEARIDPALFSDAENIIPFADAGRLLRDTHLAVTKIAIALDYADTAAFDRAFRRCSGTSPTAWRSASVGEEAIPIKCQAGLPTFSPTFRVAPTVTQPAMLGPALLEGERKYSAIWYRIYRLPPESGGPILRPRKNVAK